MKKKQSRTSHENKFIYVTISSLFYGHSISNNIVADNGGSGKCWSFIAGNVKRKPKWTYVLCVEYEEREEKNKWDLKKNTKKKEKEKVISTMQMEQWRILEEWNSERSVYLNQRNGYDKII